MNNLFTPEHIVITDLFGDNVKFIIPGYQRRYEWDCEGKSERNNQINMMWDDLYEFFINNSENENPYFFGSMVMREVKNREFEVIDGQQRLISIVILFASIKCFLKKTSDTMRFANNSDKTNFDHTYIIPIINHVDNKIFNIQRFGGVIPKEKKVKIESNTVNVNFDAVLQDVLECNDKINSSKYEEDNIISQRYYKNRKYFVQQFETYFYDSGKGFTVELANKLDRFIGFLTERVSIIRIKTFNLHDAYVIFEILNNRGLPLSNKDLFRNFVIRKFDEIKNDDPVAKWNYLELSGISDEFISRWVETINAKQQKYSAFTEIETIFNDKYSDIVGKKAIELFYEDVSSDLYNFQMILNNRIPYQEQRINFLLLCRNEKHTYNFLLALFRYINKSKISTDEFIMFKEIDNKIEDLKIRYLQRPPIDRDEEKKYLSNAMNKLYAEHFYFEHLINFRILIQYFEQYFVYILLKPGSKFSAKNINAAIGALNKMDINSAISFLKIADEEKKELRHLINGELQNNEIATLLIIKYFRLTENAKDMGKYNIDLNKVTLEHIIPRYPAEQSNWITQFSQKCRDFYTYRLGNMTLLSQPFNAAASNSDFEIKKREYNKSNFPLTRELLQTTINEQFIDNRHKEIVAKLFYDLSLDNINFVDTIDNVRQERRL